MLAGQFERWAASLSESHPGNRHSCPRSHSALFSQRRVDNAGWRAVRAFSCANKSSYVLSNQAQPNNAFQPTRASVPFINVVAVLASGVVSLAWSAEC
jgi:hypothetical protein